MGKPSRRPGRAARNVHAQIREEANQLRQAPRSGVRDAEELPAVAGLMVCARRAVESAVPSTIEYEGRRYFIRVHLAVQIDIFDTPGASDPLVCGVVFSSDGFGHVPGH
ncbi:MAG: hypothetical protein JNJ71_07675 [Rubrivivax sp.]|nr:hypothetical protein [Rubrivivax sp.]